MVIRRKIGLIIIVCSLIVILVINITNHTSLYGWSDFKKGAVANYSFVSDISVDSIAPPYININYTLNRKIDMKEVDKIFIYTKKYILSEKAFMDLQKLHIKKYKYSFSTININLIYRENDKKSLCQISLSEEVDGKPSYTDFNSWIISYYDEPWRSYIPVLE